MHITVPYAFGSVNNCFDGQPLKNISYPKRMIVPSTMMRKNILIKVLPFKMASLAPNMEPIKLQAAIGMAY